MNAAFPYAEVEATVEHYQRLMGHSLPDEDDRHVLAAAVAAEASVLCTANMKDVPGSVTASTIRALRRAGAPAAAALMAGLHGPHSV